ncbi:protein of unknown function [Burkholderia multivorans]
MARGGTRFRPHLAAGERAPGPERCARFLSACYRVTDAHGWPTRADTFCHARNAAQQKPRVSGMAAGARAT